MCVYTARILPVLSEMQGDFGLVKGFKQYRCNGIAKGSLQNTVAMVNFIVTTLNLVFAKFTVATLNFTVAPLNFTIATLYLSLQRVKTSVITVKNTVATIKFSNNFSIATFVLA